ncbi:hypothetical protein PHYBLDRAFT_58395 [Phycomyces blakesleeanus NRRL 1555(-)]|uniref:Transposase domain-containing protein n=1 Tax=Phycomyces blakesleeanus (strain ATCC 8743b / DSM 1359 / FGSC 10004 / NBRC 33097 / NRRL 1555) TaxID=763407 RepID=A0A162YA80_PHYB8|nr:hypothetical protein PHYBLDRAFT_58395 [Phycomyces blakesleeanus NRRL 1555(-)]OAD79345.1 hypothetical protein PHYBLDRAFT_58395 [Phycomyces blakesleeanus NRRL 1555(-)]|eukprot:XP_018297385.1 hypothetical protein PHYBLDRAFT_58395 [Phycomyces blakesleeanus NRRL 1555(-)]
MQMFYLQDKIWRIRYSVLIIKRSVETTVSYVSEVINNDEQNSVAIDNDYDMDYDFDEMDTSIEVDMETQEPIRVLPLSESDAVFGYENEEFNSDLDSDGCEDDSSEDDMLDSEDNFPEFNSELSFIHRFIIQVLALFVSLYVINEGAILLIAIMNKILELFRDPFCLPVSIPGLKSMAGFNTFTDGIKKYVSCSKCHSIYENNESTPHFCIFDKFGNNSMCGNSLFKLGNQSSIPKRTYVYHSVQNSIKALFSRPDFETQIDSWNHSPKAENTMFDVYNGLMWKDLKDTNGIPFVHGNRSLMLTLNIDWFQPFDGVTYLCGAIYLAVNNLPRSLYKGVRVQTYQCPNGTTIRAALFMVACDIPAARKVCGFTSHTSTNACHKCNRQFSRLAGTSSVDYSGFDFSKWLLRTKNDNSERHRLEVENGVRWSKLHRLQYFDVVHCTIIDPMHNLFLGTAKRMMEKWVADVVLQGVLPKQKFENWMFFVNACHFLTKPNVSEDDVQSAHIALEKFGKGCERLYSKDLLSPNMHLHLHLRDTIKDFGPVYGYWLFSFERSGFEMTYMKTFIEDTRKGDFVHNFLKTSGPFNFSGIFDKLVTGYRPADSTTSTALYNWFSLPDFLDAAENPNLSIRGNEPLPPSALPLQKKAYEMMPRQEYDCLVGYYQAVYNDPTISSCKDVIQDTAFVNDWIEMLKSVNLLGQTFKGSREGRNGTKYVYVGEIHPLVSTPHHRTLQSSQHTFAYVKWYKASKETSKKIAGVEIWDVAFSLPDFQSILPVHQILLPVAIVDHTTLRNISKKLIVPLPRKLYF